MNKTFREILAEKDDEYTYTVRSTADIHDGERCERIRMTFMPYQIKSIESDGYTPLCKENKWFPDEPNSPTYAVKIVTGLPIQKEGFIQTLAMMLHIHEAHLDIEGEEDIETDIVNGPELIDKEFSQSLVGQKRIGEFVRELQTDRKDREKNTITREVYECYFTTHRGLENLTKKSFRNGYYMIETYKDNHKLQLRAEGPFRNRPDGNQYRDHIGVNNPKLISESDIGGVSKVVMLIDSIVTDPTDEIMFEVSVQDLDSGRRFTTKVRAPDANVARKMAVKQVAETHRLDPKTLTSLAPKET
jgi:hypothetical protein